MSRRPKRPPPPSVEDSIALPATCTDCGKPVQRTDAHCIEEDFLDESPPTVAHLHCPGTKGGTHE